MHIAYQHSQHQKNVSHWGHHPGAKELNLKMPTDGILVAVAESNTNKHVSNVVKD
jgi:hypothetical protein